MISLKYLLIIFSLLLTSGSWCDLTEINYISLPNKLDNYKSYTDMETLSDVEKLNYLKELNDILINGNKKYSIKY